MFKIISTTKVQQKIGDISSTVGEQSYIVTNRGQARIVMLPYFDGCDENIQEYREDFEMAKNREALQERYKKSVKSGKGNFII